jgi:hypothetical protein
MAKLHTYYITNAKSELKYVYQGLPEEKFYEEVEKNLSEHLAEDDLVEVEEDDDGDDEDLSEDEDLDSDEDVGEDSTDKNERIDEYLNLASEELRRLLEVQVVEVRIDQPPVDHGEKDFDVNALIQEQFNEQ